MGGARDGGLKKLREELEAENSGMHIQLRSDGWAEPRSGPVSRQIRTAPLRWWPRFSGRRPLAASAMVGSDYSDAATRSTPSGAWRPDAFCSRCGGWKHIAPHCPAAAPRCTLCAKNHLTTDNRCPVEGCRAGKGHPYPHGEARCANCGGSHGARADACAAKREAHLSTRGGDRKSVV